MSSDLEHQYSLEKNLAQRLREASPKERAQTYSEVYDELYRAFPALKTQATHEADQSAPIFLRLLRPFLSRSSVFLELGAGSGHFSQQVAPLVKTVYAYDVSREFSQLDRAAKPTNLQRIFGDGTNIPLPDNTVDVAFSNQMMEHLHPDDAATQLREVLRVLVPGGTYICLTPHRFSGPHDVSRGFSDTATGLHLHEYTNRELAKLFQATGFRQVYALAGFKGFYVRLPLGAIELEEHLLSPLPIRLRRIIAGSLFGRMILGIKLVGVK